MKILFIGNSFTYFNEMPDMVRAMLDGKVEDLTVEKVTKGGYYLSQHLDEDDALEGLAKKKLAATKWDYVILQEQSFCPIGDYERFERGVIGLSELIKPTGAKILMYSTWAYRDGSEKLAKAGIGYEEMRDGLLAAYTKAGESVGAEIIPVGNLFYNIMKNHPEIDLLVSDNYHPTRLGSLTAAALFTLTVGGDPDSALVDLEDSDRELGKTVVKEAKAFFEIIR